MKIKLILILLLFLNNFAFAKTKFEKRFEKDLNKISKLNSFVDNEGNPYELDENINKDKTIITIRLNFCTNPARREIVLRGENGQIICDLINGKLTKIISYKKQIIHDKNSKKQTNLDNFTNF